MSVLSETARFVRAIRVTCTSAADSKGPVILAIDDANPNSANVRFLCEASRLPADVARYERVVLVFNGDDEEAAAGARTVWTESKSLGFDVTYWQTDERGRWQRKA